MPTLHTFNYTGGVQTLVVPAGVEGAILRCVGARGNGADASQYGMGAEVIARIEDLVPGETLYIVVGGMPPSNYVGGYPDGGSVGTSDVYRGLAGGGSTSIGRTSSADANRIIVGGAGGGRSPRSTYQKGGDGGHPVGGNGGGGGAGTGGTQSAGGSVTYPGSFGQGGSSPNTGATRSGGGGGGGWYGGGAGANGSSSNPAGGGGSSYYGTLDLISAEATGTNTGHGVAQITLDDPQSRIEIPGELSVEVAAQSTVKNWKYPRAFLVWVHGIDGTRRNVID